MTGLVLLSFEGEVIVLGPPNTKEEFNSTGVGVFELREEGLYVAGCHTPRDTAWLMLESLSEHDETSSVSAGKTSHRIQELLLQ